jgi:hypothetical protein
MAAKAKSSLLPSGLLWVKLTGYEGARALLVKDINVCAEFEMLQVKVLITFLGTVGFSQVTLFI